MLVGGTIDFGRLYYQQIVLSNAARDGARLASYGPVAYPNATVQNKTQLAAQPLLTSTPLVTACTGPGMPATVTVTTSTAFQWTVLGFLNLPQPTPTGKATMTCV
jgi:Flp pilus assembly protein TadG